MVSSIISAPAKLMAKLSAMHRWAVTGTPIQKSMDDLFGLISFLNCSPYNERNKWIDVLNQFQWKMNVQPIIDVLEPIMWRTCKSKAILNQINIPEQSEVVHFIQMSDVENLYYNIEHRKCWDAFCDHAKKFDTNSRLAGLNPHLFRIVSSLCNSTHTHTHDKWCNRIVWINLVLFYFQISDFGAAAKIAPRLYSAAYG